MPAHNAHTRTDGAPARTLRQASRTTAGMKPVHGIRPTINMGAGATTATGYDTGANTPWKKRPTPRLPLRKNVSMKGRPCLIAPMTNHGAPASRNTATPAATCGQRQHAAVLWPLPTLADRGISRSSATTGTNAARATIPLLSTASATHHPVTAADAAPPPAR